LVKDRIRRPPSEGWSWIDRRFLRDYAPKLEQDAILLYFFLVAVSDKNGLSYYSDCAIGGQLRMEESAVGQARQELESHDLIAYEDPIYQVLSVRSSEPRRTRGDSGLTSIGDILRQLASS
jgi:hypothetical protein